MLNVSSFLSRSLNLKNKSCTISHPLGIKHFGNKKFIRYVNTTPIVNQKVALRKEDPEFHSSPYLTLFERTLSPRLGDSSDIHDIERMKVVSMDLFLYQKERILDKRKTQQPPVTKKSVRKSKKLSKDVVDNSRYDLPPQPPLDVTKVAEIKSPDIVALREKYGEGINEQIEIESQAIERESLRYRKMVNEVSELGLGAETNPAQKILIHWFKPLRDAISRKLESDHVAKKQSYIELLRLISPDKLAVITLHHTVGATLKSIKGVPFNSLCGTLGDLIQAQINYEILKDELGDSRFERLYGKAVTLGKMSKISKRTLQERSKNASRAVKIDAGKFLLTTLIEVANFQHKTETNQVKTVPAFELEFPKSANKYFNIKTVRIAKHIIDTISYEHVMKESNFVRHYPMVIKPKPWTSPEDGGYFLHPVSILRYYSYSSQIKPLFENQDQMKVIYEALNALGETAWRINTDVYNVVKQAWEEGGGIAELPSRHDIPFPEVDETGKTREWFKQYRKVEQENYNLHSLRCDLLLKLEVAEKFKDRVIYFPHNMDFRGRVYPIPPHLNHMGADICRGLLTFAEGKPLGKRGLWWLKVQLANLYGKDKVSFEERVQFADENMDNVFDSATNPLRGNRWWLNAEDPWQCLACCFELYKAITSPDPEQYICHLPIHQDGTCNGLQHYAALGGDEKGAKSVNLTPSDRPQDVYSDVSKLVVERIEQDVKNEVPIAMLLQGKVDRRIIKQTVMTSVYGVTFIGARKQIENALKDRNVLNEEERAEASIYLTKLTFDSLGEMFAGANMIMDWFSTCASLISKQGKLVTWVTPLGLPVAQPYKKPNKKNVTKTAFQTFLADDERSMTIDTSRQRSAFPPNFVHCLDSSHMLLTALECKKKNITYASVHDSFWTHASTVDEMNVILREAFVDLYKRPILEYLYEHFKYHNPEIDFPPIPKRGDFDMELVKKSTYFFN